MTGACQGTFKSRQWPASHVQSSEVISPDTRDLAPAGILAGLECQACPRSDTSHPGTWQRSLQEQTALCFSEPRPCCRGRVHPGWGSGEGAELPRPCLHPARLTLDSGTPKCQGQGQTPSEDPKALKWNPAYSCGPSVLMSPTVAKRQRPSQVLAGGDPQGSV